MTDPRFDPEIDRFGTHSVKWDMMEKIYGVPADDGLSMWVADMDFRPPQAVLDCLQKQLDHGVLGYFGNDTPYREAICWWMQNRHGWSVDPASIFTTHGLVNGTALCIDAFTNPGDGVVLMTPVYHAFARVISAAQRRVVELPMGQDENGLYSLNLPIWEQMMTGRERMLILCSPHNPGGRVWTREELEAIAVFAQRHDLIIVSDEIHHDIVMPGHTHIPMTAIDGIEDRLVMMTATSKTFNLAGLHTGNVIIVDPALRSKFAARMAALGLSPNSLGLFAAMAAYTPEGAEWVDGMCAYIDGNRRVFDDAVNQIPGLRSMPLQSTYLSWVDFSGTGMTRDEFTGRVEQGARIAANHGPTFGRGGEEFLRFNIATPRARVEEAARRLADAFSDLQ